jgi:hypothetical protein
MSKIFPIISHFLGFDPAFSGFLKFRRMLLALMLMNAVTAMAVPLSGIKTIGGISPDYPSFTLAIAALSIEGVGPGGVTFLVAPGIYNESVTINPITGAGPSSRVTFQANGGPVSINAVGTSGTDIVVKLNGADYLIFDAISATNGGTSAANHCEIGYDLATIGTTDGASNNIIRNCSINMTGGVEIPVSSRGIRFLTPNATSSSGTHNNNKFQNLLINGVERGISIFGTTGFAVSNIEVSNCTFGNIRAIGNNASGASGTGIAILANYVSGCSIFSNIIDSVKVSNVAATGGAYGIQVFSGSGEVYGNQIRYVVQGNTAANGTAIGIYCGSSLNGSLKIHNNFVSGIDNAYAGAVAGNTVSVNGLFSVSAIAGGGAPVHWYFNTVRLSSPFPKNSASAALSVSNANGGHQAIVKNNILINEISNVGTTRSFAIIDFNATAPSGLLVSGNNDLAASGSNSFIGLNNTSPQIYSLSLVNWQTANPGLDANSVSVFPAFMSANDMHLNPAFNASLQDAGVPIPGILADVDLFIRDLAAPEIGADEICVNAAVPAISIASNIPPVITAGDTLIFTAIATNAGATPFYQWYVSGNPVGTNSDTYTDHLLQSGDVVSCNLVSSLTCTTILPTGSNPVSITVYAAVPATDSIRNITVENGQDSCYSATDTIFVAGGASAFLVQNGGSARLIAGKSIFLFPGATVHPGGYLLGSIAPGGPFCEGAPAAAPVFASTKETVLSNPGNDFRIYPNPTSGEFALEIPGDQSDKITEILIYDMRGNRIMGNSYSNTGKVHLSLAGKPSGIYLLRVISGNHSDVYKIIKQ